MKSPFEWFDLKESFHVSEDALRTAYMKAIKSHHPDRFLHDSEAYERALQASANIHEAYQLLSKPLELTGYLLKNKGVLEEKESLPQDFLFEMMDLNEQLDEIEQADVSALNQTLKGWEDDLNEKLLQSIEKYEQGDTGQLAKIKDSYLKMKYILRLKDRLVNFAPR